MNETYDKKNRQTEAAIKRALSKLYYKKPRDEITIIDICKECRINRSTFYRHYDNIKELEEAIAVDIIERLSQSNQKILRAAPSLTESYIRGSMLEHVKTLKQNRMRLLPFFAYNDSVVSKRYVQFVLENVESIRSTWNAPYKLQYEYINRFSSAGSVAVIYRWLVKQDLSCEEFAEFLYKMTVNLINLK